MTRSTAVSTLLCFAAVVVLQNVAVASAFAPPQVAPARSLVRTLMKNEGNNESSSLTRRTALRQSLLLGIVGSMAASPAQAKEVELLRPENAKAAFDDLRFELNNPGGGVAQIQKLIDNNDLEAVLDFTKTYDLTLRKQKIGRAKKQLTDIPSRDISTLTANAITFDLIGINRNCRPGQQSAENANKYLNELRTDLRNMIDMEKTINYSEIELF